MCSALSCLSDSLESPVVDWSRIDPERFRYLSWRVSFLRSKINCDEYSLGRAQLYDVRYEFSKMHGTFPKKNIVETGKINFESNCYLTMYIQVDLSFKLLVTVCYRQMFTFLFKIAHFEDSVHFQLRSCIQVYSNNNLIKTEYREKLYRSNFMKKCQVLVLTSQLMSQRKYSIFNSYRD